MTLVVPAPFGLPDVPLPVVEPGEDLEEEAAAAEEEEDGSNVNGSCEMMPTPSLLAEPSMPRQSRRRAAYQ